MGFEHNPDRCHIKEEEFWAIINGDQELTDEEYERAKGLVNMAEDIMEERHGDDWNGWDSIEASEMDEVDKEITKVMKNGHIIEKADLIFDVIDHGQKTEKALDEENRVYQLLNEGEEA